MKIGSMWESVCRQVVVLPGTSDFSLIQTNLNGEIRIIDMRKVSCPEIGTCKGQNATDPD
jgi:hypothetical protein